jgi:hypothetical protein
MSTSIELKTRMSHEYTLSHSSETILHSHSQREKTYRERETERKTHKSSRTPIYAHMRWQSYLTIPLKIGKSTTPDRLGCTCIYINLFTHKVNHNFTFLKEFSRQLHFFFITFPPQPRTELSCELFEGALYLVSRSHARSFLFAHFYFYVSLSHPRSHRCFLGKHFIKIVTARQNTLFFFPGV